MTQLGPTNERILVTGGAGFIGARLAGALLDDNDVAVLDSLVAGDRSTVPGDARFIEADLRDADALERAVAEADTVFHEAAVVSVARSVEDPLESHAVNAESTLRLLEAARRHDVRVVLASSAAIYGHPESIPVGEPDRKEPTSPYGLEKLAADHYAHLYHDLYGLDAVPLRYFNVYGPGQSGGDYAGVIRVFVERALNDDPITVHGDGDQTRDFVFVDDVVRANLAAATTDAVGEAYNVGTGESITIRELAELVRDLADANSDIVHAEPREGDIDRSEADVSKARARLDFEPTVSIRDGLDRTVDWYRQRLD
ncbi:NAD-dependent epimerase/dehydratase family protein [Halovivax sp.]|uniref:NAD-dependent epimerase/dehydratase family protein n=1 Tax=Halovivax sp. TaxID=1935978 RepID=UPI0025C5C25B|nr:NAD-dependent epimerase/dehydratase family protein [Halovivax sp.]